MPRDTLTRDQIIRAAIDLLDEQGLEGLNMRSLGERLGSAATAVYWHVKNKDDLVMLAGDHVWHEIELPDLATHEWREAATIMANGLLAMITRHSWMVLAMGTHLFHGAGKARHDDHSLAVYEKAGFVGGEADRAMATVFMFVLGSALGESASVALTRRLQRRGDAEQQLRATVEQATEIAMQFPRLRARFAEAESQDYNAAPDQSFEFGLATILNGLETRLASTARR